MLCTAGREHAEITLGKTIGGLFIDRIERVHEAIAERVSVDVERRMDEMRDVHPVGLVARLDLDRGPKALALHGKPDLADPFRRQFAVAALGVQRALE